MSLRTRLIIAFLLLSVVPLSAVTFVTYRSWVATFEAAAQQEAAQSAVDIGRRMERITADVGRRVDRLFVAPGAAPPPSAETVRERVAPVLDDPLAFVDRIEFRPFPSGARPRLPDAPGAPERPDLGRQPDGEGRGPGFGPPGGGRGGRGRGGGGPPGPPTPAPEVIVVDVQEAIEEARRAAQAALAAVPDSVPLTPAQAELPRAARVQVDGGRLEIAVTQDGQVVGTANAMLNLRRTLQTVFAFARRDLGEIPFALDTDGVLHNPDEDQRRTLESFGAAALGRAATDGRPRRAGDWLIVARQHPSGMIFGIARPIGESLREIRRASLRNLSLGLLVIAVALIGIVPISHRMTRHLTSLNAGVRQLATGDFRARVPVRSRDEFGSLAAAFNQMAEDLERHQALVVERERLRRELELSRQIQIAMLPRGSLRLGPAEIKGISIPAREVGGDFFNYFPLDEQRLALLVGDVSGKGVSAALLMANVQATLRARLAIGGNLAALAADLDREIDRATPGAVYLTLFMGVLDASRGELRYVNAGHNPPFVLHAAGGVEAMAATGLPIALYPGQPYVEHAVPVHAGDLVFFYTDGLVEAENADGEMFGSERLQLLLSELQLHEIDALLEHVERAVRQFRGPIEPFDDATMMALRFGTGLVSNLSL
jgi:serine phosphatase RsbU (regulator of sigma subunit)